MNEIAQAALEAVQTGNLYRAELVLTKAEYAVRDAARRCLGGRFIAAHRARQYAQAAVSYLKGDYYNPCEQYAGPVRIRAGRRAS